MRVAVFGLGRSGLAVAKAATDRGDQVTIYDEKSADQLAKPELLSEAQNYELQLGEPFPKQLETDLIVVNPAIDPRKEVITNQSAEVIGEIEYAYRVAAAPIIAITGTNGKSTTTAMVHHSLKKLGVDAVLCGNIFGSGLEEKTLTEAAATSTEDQVLVAEVSSFQLDTVKHFKPKVACITTITPDHLDRYDSFQSYAASKYHITQVQEATDYFVVNANLRPPKTKAKTFTFGDFGDARAKSDGVHVLGKTHLGFRFKVLGTHNYANIVAASLCVYAFLSDAFNAPNASNAIQALRTRVEASGKSLIDNIVESLYDFPGLEHRMEWVAEKDKVTFINNSMCTNPAAVVASLKAVNQTVHVLVGGVNKDLSFEPLKAYLSRTDHAIYLFGRDAVKIADELGSSQPVYSTMSEAFNVATKSAKEGQIIMLAPGCASMDQFKDFRHRGDVFRQLVKDWTK